jgi:hypothetical protein
MGRLGASLRPRPLGDAGRARARAPTPAERRRRAPRLRSIALSVLAVAIVVALVLGIGPQAFARAARGFDPVDAPIVAAPVATITVQELTYILLLVAPAVPAALHHRVARSEWASSWRHRGHHGHPPGAPRLPAGGRGGPAPPRPAAVHRRRRGAAPRHRPPPGALGHAALVRRQRRPGGRPHHDVLVRRPRPRPGLLSWTNAAFVIAVAYIAGAVGLLPGGLGGFEAACIGMLVALGAPHGVAAAASLLQRAGDKGLATLYGLAAYVVARRRLRLHEVTVVRHGQRRMRPTPR